MTPDDRATRGPARDLGVDTAAARRGAAASALDGGSAGAGQGAALAAALDRVGDRWSLLLASALLDGPRRFGELGDAVAGIAPNILADRLRRLERGGIVRATPYSTRPPRVEYALTADGRELAGALRLLADWGARHVGDAEDATLRHEPCGTPLEARWWCPTCDSPAEGVDTDEVVQL